MEYKLINVGSYLLIISDHEINVGDYITDTYRVWKWNDNSSLLGRKKVICHLPLNDSPILDGVDLLPPIEDENLNEMIKNNWNELNKIYMGGLNQYGHEIGFREGYNKCKEMFKYTEEDLMNLFELTKQGKIRSSDKQINLPTINDYVKSISQPKLPIGFKYDTMSIIPDEITVWVGEYIF